MTDVHLREAVIDDAAACARVMWNAFESLATAHNFPVEPASPEFTAGLMQGMLSTEGTFGLVAECGDEIVGSALQDERATIVGVGPVSVSPTQQQGRVGHALMEALLQRSRERDVAGVRLVQTAYNYRSLSLYAKLGFAVREPLSVFQRPLDAVVVPSTMVRPATLDDVDECDHLCRRIHGHDRHPELRTAIARGMASVVQRRGQITAYTTGLGYIGHAVGETDDDIIALLGAAEQFVGLGVLVPSRNPRLMTWCLHNGLRLVQQSTLMTIGLYNEPQGAWLPSIGY
ncbi:GNAT family N-acetyltransferase [Mycobacterium sp. IS-3022]|uniref:GNAT family N-acetyltransferase n=1 Tax=Mycobacterium sp. IS-3022 TaxID=1772277 RepID=UPI0007417BFA|nr:GNAT family N-acetyltransferase [Mycobacterium sp. IS-3022]KUI01020.1 acyltransferase [Mycobacterium sp. IS-3022]